MLLEGSNDQVASIGKQSFIVVKQRSSITGWTLLILTPVNVITKGISVLRMTIVLSAIMGTLLFILLSFFLSTLNYPAGIQVDQSHERYPSRHSEAHRQRLVHYGNSGTELFL